MIRTIALLLGVSAAVAFGGERIVLRNGEVYEDVRIEAAANEAYVSIVSSSGITRVPKSVLPEELAAKWGYDPKLSRELIERESDARLDLAAQEEIRGEVEDFWKRNAVELSLHCFGVGDRRRDDRRGEVAPGIRNDAGSDDDGAWQSRAGNRGNEKEGAPVSAGYSSRDCRTDTKPGNRSGRCGLVRGCRPKRSTARRTGTKLWREAFLFIRWIRRLLSSRRLARVARRGPKPLLARRQRWPHSWGGMADYKIGNEKLIRVLDAASAKLRSLLERQGRPQGRCVWR